MRGGERGRRGRRWGGVVSVEQLLLWCAHASDKDMDVGRGQNRLRMRCRGCAMGGRGCVLYFEVLKNFVRVCCTQ